MEFCRMPELKTGKEMSNPVAAPGTEPTFLLYEALKEIKRNNVTVINPHHLGTYS